MTAGGPEDADFARLYHEEFAVAAHAAYTINRSAVRAEELAQDAFAAAYARWDHVRALDRPGAWVRRVAINLALKDRDKQRRVRTTPDGVVDAQVRDRVDRESRDVLKDAIDALPQQQRLAVVLHYLHDLPVADVAASLDCAESTAKVHLHRARAALAKVLDPEVMAP